MGSETSVVNAAESLGVDESNAKLRPLDAAGRVRWAVETFGENAVLLSSMQKTSSVIVHFFYELGLKNEVLFVDTGYHFHETLWIRDEFMRRYRINMVTLYPELTPAQQEEKYQAKLFNFVDGQPQCCAMRKEEPFINYVKGQGRRLVMTGLMKSEGGKRGKLEPLMKDPRINGFTLQPIFDWDDAQVEDYLKQHDVPVHPLHAKSFPSIGCQVCTTPVKPGEDARAGRWRHLRGEGEEGPRYCGINFTDGSGI